MKHSLFGASSASRWSACAGSLILSLGIPRYGNAAAAEGTAGHTLGERCIDDQSEPLDFIGEVIPVTEGDVIVANIEVTDDLATAVQCYVDYVRGITGIRWLESKIFYAHLIGVPEEDGFGTGDCYILDGTTLHVLDAKFGRGYVNPVKNKQMILYAAGVVDAMETVGETVEKVVLHVVQPRVSEKPVPYEMTRDDLREEVEKLHAAAQLSQEASFSFTSLADAAWVKKYLNPGENQCQWCPAAGICPALRAVSDGFTAACDEEFGIVNLLEQMPGKELNKYQSQVGLVEIWAKAVEHETMRRLTRGDKDITDWKLVTGREGNRRWADPATAAEAFADLPVEVTHSPAELKSPPQLEKALKGKENKERREKIAAFVVRNPPKPTLTTADDPREPWVEAADTDEFAVVQN